MCNRNRIGWFLTYLLTDTTGFGKVLFTTQTCTPIRFSRHSSSNRFSLVLTEPLSSRIFEPNRVRYVTRSIKRCTAFVCRAEQNVWRTKLKLNSNAGFRVIAIVRVSAARARAFSDSRTVFRNALRSTFCGISGRLAGVENTVNAGLRAVFYNCKPCSGTGGPVVAPKLV